MANMGKLQGVIMMLWGKMCRKWGKKWHFLTQGTRVHCGIFMGSRKKCFVACLQLAGREEDGAGIWAFVAGQEDHG